MDKQSNTTIKAACMYIYSIDNNYKLLIDLFGLLVSTKA
jgi:hypothetical protein